MAWQTGFWFFVFIPIIDQLRGINTKNPRPEEEAKAEASWRYKLAVWLWIPVQIALIIRGLQVVVNGNLSTWETIGITISIGLITGAIGITWGHELCHRANKVELILAEILLSSVSYTHFVIEHVYGHHKNVATFKDPATSRLNESFYRFYFRSVFGGIISAWRIESLRMAKKSLPTFSLSNRMLRYGLVQVLIYSTLWTLFGWKGIAFFAAQSVVAFSMLEVINYLEHYGLERKELETGKYERVQPHHSWNSSHVVSNIFLLNLARHSDHHYMAARRYQILRHFDDSPQLPAGYATMFLLSLVPPLWFKVMNPRVAAWRENYANDSHTKV
ncbi:MAG: alkane 1-monooxygenase [Rhodospirillales bacterium]|nr:alkane 1-monooxygenase [Rhodospirillales bacterium]